MAGCCAVAVKLGKNSVNPTYLPLNLVAKKFAVVLVHIEKAKNKQCQVVLRYVLNLIKWR